MSNEARKQMDKALKECFVPELRKIGFKGSFPHFKRLDQDKLDLLMVQFYSAGGSFVVEIGQCEPEGYTNAKGYLTPATKVKVISVFPRLRLGSNPDAGVNDHWFKFNNPNYDSQEQHTYEHYQQVAKEAASFLNQANEWWALNKSKQKDA